MPTYTFRNKETGEEKTEVMSMSARDRYLEENPHIEQLIVSAAGFIPGVSMKPDGVFRDMLKEMKKASPGSTIETF